MMNGTGMYEAAPKPADAPIEAGVVLFKMTLVNRERWTFYTAKAVTTNDLVKGRRVLKQTEGEYFFPDDGTWFVRKSDAVFAAARILLKEKDALMERVFSLMDEAHDLRSEEREEEEAAE